MRRRAPWALPLIGGLIALVAAACGGDAASEPVATPTEAAPAATAATDGLDTADATPADAGATPADAVATFDFPTGPVVTVAANYEPPEDHVPSTGAYLPANGKPTLVFVDAIW